MCALGQVRCCRFRLRFWYLAGVVVDDKASVPAAEVLMRAHLTLQLLQQRLVGALALGVHGGAHVVQDTHHSWRILGSSPMRTD